MHLGFAINLLIEVWKIYCTFVLVLIAPSAMISCVLLPIFKLNQSLSNDIYSIVKWHFPHNTSRKKYIIYNIHYIK